MMGKLQSKHECFYVSADVNREIEDKIWKQKTGFNLANYNMEDTFSEVSICLHEASEGSPLRVDLPPQKLETDTSKVLKLDHVGVASFSNKDGGDKNRFSIEEIQYGLQFESSENAKQEWSFTLYDFDGHGRITKEDLASLLKALYDAVGSSIKLPANGAKTLKLRLSVGQDGTPQLQNGSCNPKLAERSKNITRATKSKVREFSKLNNLTRTQVKCTNQNQAQLLLSREPAVVSEQLTDGKVQGPSGHLAEVKGQGLSGQLAEVKGLSGQLAVAGLAMPNRQQLANLVQQNMDRNQIKHLRRHHSDTKAEGHHHHHKRRHRLTAGNQCPVTTVCAALSATMTAVISEEGKAVANGGGAESHPAAAEEACQERAKESQDRRNYYLDLAGIENNHSKFQNNPTVPVAGSGCVRTGSGHHRSRSYEVTNGAKCDNLHANDKCDNNLIEKCDNLPREADRVGNKVVNGKCELQHPRSKSFDPQDATGPTRSPKTHQKQPNLDNPAKQGRFRPVSLPSHVPVTVSPHHHRRHRHRDKDHDMAMQQVAQWIEREHAWETTGERVLLQRHEHHHIHEHHHHHHYHHYYEA